MSEKHIEILDAAIASKDSDTFIKAVFAEQRNNPATLNKVRDAIAFRLTKSDVSDADKTTMRKLRDDLNAYIARGCTDKTVREVLDSNVKYESDFKKNGSSPKTE